MVGLPITLNRVFVRPLNLDASGIATLSSSQSAFHSWSFLAATAVGLFCVIYSMFLLVRYWHQLSSPGALTLWMAACGTVAAWKRVFGYYNRARRSYGDHVFGGQADPIFRDVLNLAEVAITDSIFFSFTVILLLLIYAGHLLKAGHL